MVKDKSNLILFRRCIGLKTGKSYFIWKIIAYIDMMVEKAVRQGWRSTDGWSVPKERLLTEKEKIIVKWSQLLMVVIDFVVVYVV